MKTKVRLRRTPPLNRKLRLEKASESRNPCRCVVYDDLFRFSGVYERESVGLKQPCEKNRFCHGVIFLSINRAAITCHDILYGGV